MFRTRTRKLGAIALSFMLASCANTAFGEGESEDWQVLFDGASLDGWAPVGGTAPFEVVDGAIVGTSIDGTPNTFLVTQDKYQDFIFEADFRVTGSMNSGIMFRANDRAEGDRRRVYGLQAEYDSTSRAFSGGIYDEARRGWIHPITQNDACKTALKHEEWNRYRIEAFGPEIRTFINGAPCARLVDDRVEEGYFGLQVHSIGRSGAVGDQALWRDLRVKTENVESALTPLSDEVVEISYLVNELTEWEQATGVQLLWDGKTSNGWISARGDTFPEKGWRIEDGQIIVAESGGGEASFGGDLITEDEFTDFELEVDFKLSEGANSGIKYFVDPDLLQGEGSAIGLEFQILDDAVHPDAKMGVAGNRTIGSLYDLITAANLIEPGRDKRVNPIGEWNRARIVVRGGKVEHWMNNIPVVEYDRRSQMFRALVAYSKYADWPNFGEWDSGPILLQDHGDEVAFRNIKIKDLSFEAD